LVSAEARPARAGAVRARGARRPLGRGRRLESLQRVPPRGVPARDLRVRTRVSRARARGSTREPDAGSRPLAEDMNEQRVESWQELQELLFDDMWNDDLGLFRSRFAYRGIADADTGLESGLVRLGGD